MYWIGLTLALVSGLLSINLVREALQNLVPAITVGHLDKALLVFLVIGLAITTAKYLSDQRQIDLLGYQDITGVRLA